ncbi:MAG: DUF4398 domain-containing protein [Pseudomonadota bacterium]|nr:DUF4398 domain-containing protein [Pseudomonadota bacterium]
MNLSFLTPGLLLIAIGANAAGCATTKPLYTEGSTAAIRSAEELGAPEVPQASLHLQLAKEELEAATALNEKGDEDEAKSMLLRAEADAELAIALSRADAEKTAAQAAMDRVRKLQSENPYAPGGAK